MSEKPIDKQWAKLRARDFGDLVAASKSLLANKKYPGFINSIRFPHYRNLAKDLRLDFKFPLTVLTGPNGSGKSSVLQALYGAPEDYSVGRYWFSTEVDPITDSDEGRRPSFVYEYLNDEGGSFIALKTRIRKKFAASMLAALGRPNATAEEAIHDPNYWEPSRPLAWAGMTPRKDGSRDPAVKREVVYLHFRTQLSAFESAFYGGGLPTTERREFLRRKSRYLLRAFDGLKIPSPRGKAQSHAPVTISAAALEEIGQIVGKRYAKAQIVEHKLFGGTWGQSVRFSLSSGSYSDAFAGSGESAIFRLVVALQGAKEGSLIILDEPEISLHPDAQRRVQHLLLAYSIQKKLQFVVATHSSQFVDRLPPEAIFLFQPQPDGKFSAANTSAELALVSIGQDISKRCVMVEDVLCKDILERILPTVDANAHKVLEVKAIPGGAPAIFAALAIDPTKNLIAVLDGDQKPTSETVEKAKFLLDKVNVTRNEWDEVLARLTDNKCPTFHTSGDSSGHAVPEQAIAARRDLAQAILTRVQYLPGSGSPEALLWNHDAVTRYFDAAGHPGAAVPIANLSHPHGAKDAIFQAAAVAQVPYQTVLSTLVSRWVASRSAECVELQTMLKRLLGQTG